MWHYARKYYTWIYAYRYTRKFFYNGHDETDAEIKNFLELDDDNSYSYYEKLSNLIVAMKKKYDSKSAISLGIELFNNTILNRKTNAPSKVLGNIIYNENNRNNIYSNAVMTMFTDPENTWYELFHLNYIDTINLDFSEYVDMKKIADRYARDKKESADNVDEEIKKNISNMFKTVTK